MMTWSIAWWLVRTPLHGRSVRLGPRHEALGHSKYSHPMPDEAIHLSRVRDVFDPDQLRWHERYRRAFVELQSMG